MAIGTPVAGTAANGTTSCAPSYPSGISTGDLLLLCLVDKYAQPTDPSGWTLAGQAQGGAGSSGADSGQVYGSVWYKVAAGTESGTETVSISSGDSARGRILRVSSDYTAWSIASVTAVDSSAGTGWSAAAASDPGVATGDRIIVCSAVNSDAQTFSSQALAQTGVTYGAVTELEDTGTTNGDDVRLVISDHVVTSGTSSGNPTFSMTANGTSGNQPAGVSVIVRLRESGSPKIGIPTVARSFSGTTGNLNETSVSVTTGRVIALCLVQYNGSGTSIGTPATPSGVASSWTLVDNAGSSGGGQAWQAYIWVGVADGTTTVTQTLGSSHTDFRGAIVEFPDANTTTPVGVHAATANAGTGSASVSLAGALSSSLSFAIGYASGGNGADPRSGWTELTDVTTFPYFQAQYKRPADTTASVTATFGDPRDMALVAMEVLATSTGYTITASGGSFTETGQSAGLLIARMIAASAGSFSETGQAANLLEGYKLVAGAGSFAETGQPVTFPRTYKLTAAVGSFAESGQSAGLLATRILSVAQGSVALSGQATNLVGGFRLSASVGSFAETGQSAGLLATRTVPVAVGSFAESGQSASLLAARRLTAAVGSVALTGEDADLVYTPAGAFELLANAGSLALSGQSAGLHASRALVAAQGAFSEAGQPAGLSVLRRLSAAQGAITATGQSASLALTRRLTAGAGSGTLTGQDVGLHAGHVLGAAGTTCALSGNDVAFRRTFTLAAVSGAFALTGGSATLLHAQFGVAGPGIIDVLGQSAHLRHARVLVAQRGHFIADGQSVTFMNAQTVRWFETVRVFEDGHIEPI